MVNGRNLSLAGTAERDFWLRFVPFLRVDDALSACDRHALPLFVRFPPPGWAAWTRAVIQYMDFLYCWFESAFCPSVITPG